MNRCISCMAELDTYPCPRCGYIPREPLPHGLAVGSLLMDRYQVGKVLGQDDGSITYVGWDTRENQKVSVREYFPAELATRDGQADSNVRWNPQAEEQRQAGTQAFLDEARALKKLDSDPNAIHVRTAFLQNETAYLVLDPVEEPVFAVQPPAVQPPKPKKKHGKALAIVISVLLVLLVLAALTPTVILPAVHKNQIYRQAMNLLDNRDFAEAKETFTQLGDWRDSADMVFECDYRRAEALAKDGRYAEASALWDSIAVYRDSANRSYNAWKSNMDADYDAACQLMEQGDYLAAAEAFRALPNWRDSDANAAECVRLHNEEIYEQAMELAAQGVQTQSAYHQAIELLVSLGDYGDSAEQAKTLSYEYAEYLLAYFQYDTALKYYERADGYGDSKEKIPECWYEMGCMALKNGAYADALDCFDHCPDYEGVGAKIDEARFGYVGQHANREDAVACEYLQELLSKSYPGAKELREQIFGWKAVIDGFNNNPYDSKPMESISKYNTIYCHFTVTGGMEGEVIRIRTEFVTPAGNTMTYKIDDVSDGDNLWVNFYYFDPGRAPAGTATVYIYNDANGKLLTFGSVPITN